MRQIRNVPGRKLGLMRHERDLDPAMWRELRARGVDAAIGWLANAQHGVVERGQIAGLGLSERAIDWRISVRRLHVLYRGVYSVGDRAMPPLGRLMAAVLASGPDAVASHRSAAALHGLRPYEGRPEVTDVPGSKPHPGIAMKTAHLAEDETTVVRGIPVTTVARTLLDLGAVDKHAVDKAVREAEFLRVFDLDEVCRLLDRYPRRRGTAHLRKVIKTYVDSENRTRSDLEERFRPLVLGANLPTPELNGTVELGALTIEADAIWHEAKVLVELDGRQAHLTPHAFETDRERDRAAALHGWTVIRVTWRQLTRDRKRLVADLKALIAARTRS